LSGRARAAAAGRPGSRSFPLSGQIKKKKAKNEKKKKSAPVPGCRRSPVIGSRPRQRGSGCDKRLPLLCLGALTERVGPWMFLALGAVNGRSHGVGWGVSLSWSRFPVEGGPTRGELGTGSRNGTDRFLKSRSGPRTLLAKVRSGWQGGGRWPRAPLQPQIVAARETKMLVTARTQCLFFQRTSWKPVWLATGRVQEG